MSQHAPSTIVWAAPPATLALAPAEVHVWRVALTGWDPAARAATVAALSDDERERAGRFHFDRDRERFSLTRGVLRGLLGRYLDRHPAALRFRYSPYGRPSLAVPFGEASGVSEAGAQPVPAAELRFNLSHAGDLALIAVARGREVGVDVELCLPDRATRAVARLCFAQEELAMLAGMPPERWAEGFYNGWTRKEALIKARGEGLSLPLTQIAVSLLPDEPARLIRSTDPADLTRWSLQSLDPGPGYSAALAVEGHDATRRCYAHQGSGPHPL